MTVTPLPANDRRPESSSLSAVPPAIPPIVRPEAAGAPDSGIVEVFKYGAGRQGLIPLWVGEGDRPTPAFIGEAAAKALHDGETFYTAQRGIPVLREALAAYVEGLYGEPADPERYFVTIGGMHALQTAVRIAAGPGDEVLIPTPAWPNFAGAIGVAGARAVSVPMHFDRQAGWSLDVARLGEAVTPATRAIALNSPSNPTGWTATHAELAAVLDLARRHGLWIIADEIYGRFAYDPERRVGHRAPSFRDVWEAEDRERLLFVQTFSKNWAMTGWRVGWLEAPARLGSVIENLVQYSSSGVAAFLQRGAVAALTQGEPIVAAQVAAATEGRRIVCEGLRATGAVELPMPQGAFYAFPRVPRALDSMGLAKRLVDEAGVGLAPGTAFGPGGEGFQRLCFARAASDLTEVVRRLAPTLAAL